MFPRQLITMEDSFYNDGLGFTYVCHATVEQRKRSFALAKAEEKERQKAAEDEEYDFLPLGWMETEAIKRTLYQYDDGDCYVSLEYLLAYFPEEIEWYSSIYDDVIKITDNMDPDLRDLADEREDNEDGLHLLDEDGDLKVTIKEARGILERHPKASILPIWC